MIRRAPPPVLIVTDATLEDVAIERVLSEALRTIARGSVWVQLRDKLREAASLAAFAARLRSLTRRLGAGFMINGDPALAVSLDADGVHLGGGAGPISTARRLVGAARWITIAAHSDEDVVAARAAGADGVLVSPVFVTPGKGRPRGVAALRSARRSAGDLAVYALGGVDASNARSCVEAGADGVAVIRAIFAAKDPSGEMARIVAAVQSGVSFTSPAVKRNGR